MLIDSSYFTSGSRLILNATLGSASTEADEVIAGFIAERQEEFLNATLGEALGMQMQTYLLSREGEEPAEEDADMEEIASWLKQPFADYVFFHFLRDSQDQATISGMVRLKNENTYTAPMYRGVGAWNMMASRLKRFVAWADAHPSKGISISASMVTPINRFNL